MEAAAREPQLGEPSIPTPIAPLVGTMTLADDCTRRLFGISACAREVRQLAPAASVDACSKHTHHCKKYGRLAVLIYHAPCRRICKNYSKIQGRSNPRLQNSVMLQAVRTCHAMRPGRL